MILYGIPNCDTVKKARAWLEQHGVAYQFHDFKRHGVDAGLLRSWIAQLGWEKLLNRQGTTWRKLGPERQAQIIDADSAIALMLEQPSVIKRPVAVGPASITVGFPAGGYGPASVDAH